MWLVENHPRSYLNYQKFRLAFTPGNDFPIFRRYLFLFSVPSLCHIVERTLRGFSSNAKWIFKYFAGALLKLLLHFLPLAWLIIYLWILMHNLWLTPFNDIPDEKIVCGKNFFLLWEKLFCLFFVCHRGIIEIFQFCYYQFLAFTSKIRLMRWAWL